MNHILIVRVAFGILVFLFVIGSAMCAQEIHDTGAAPASLPTNYLVYIGTYTGKGSKGIYVCRFDAATGVLSPPEIACETTNPSFLDIDPRGKCLYAVNEVNEFEGKRSGSVSAFAIDAVTGKLSELNQGATVGLGPCHILIDKTGKNALVANYAGSVAVLPIQPDGQVGTASCYIEEHGKGPNAERQEHSHVHCVATDSGSRYVFLGDLGTDKVMIYRFDASSGQLAPNDPAFVSVNPGAGPRHMIFDSRNKFAYLINELQSTMTVFAWEPIHATLREVQTISTLPDDFKAFNTCAEVEISPSGKFLYASNRGHDSIAVFAIDPQNGTLTLAGRYPAGGKIPRSFTIDPSGRYILVANQDSDNVVVFALDPATGKMTPTGREIKLSVPVCVKFLVKNS